MHLSRIATELGCVIAPEFSALEVTRITSLTGADEHSISFLSDPRLLADASACRAPVMIVKKGLAIENKINLEVEDPYLGYARVALLFEDRAPGFEPPVHPCACIEADAVVDSSAHIGPGTIIGRNAMIGAHTIIGANCVIEKNVVIGADCRIDSGAIIRFDCKIGNRVIIQSGTVIGSDGFANAMDKGAFVRIPCFGIVIIEDDVQIGACVAIDRGNFEPTIIHKGVRLDNLIHIAHNVEVGEHSAMAAQVGISGSTRVGRHVMIGGQAGFVGHIEIGDGAFIGAQSGVSKSVKPGQKVTGYPAREFMSMRRIEAAQQELPGLLKQVKELRKRIDEIERNLSQEG